MAYTFFCQNLPEALPCLRTVQRMINSEYCNINEGEFRFDDLLKHINLYKAPKVISVGEDATRLISKVQYDSDTNRMVGFVLPCDNNGLPLTDTFLATTFQQMEQCFLSNDVAKYAFVYMAQPLGDNVPAFCLACLGTNNKFDFQLVQKRWSHIVSECHKRGITVISFGADGDSREMKAILLSSHLFFNETSAYSFQSNKVVIPKEWHTWFAIKVCNSVSFVQDIVHLAVKLKARLLSPSIILSVGKFLAGIHHLRLIQQTFGKDIHNMRAKDIDHKDRQNYDAAMHITSPDVLQMLSEIPDAKGTYIYLEVMRCVMDSYLDKSLDVTTRIHKAWYAVFFVRYWRQWLLLNKEYCLSANFITSNAYKCIELNAHSIVTVAMTIRDHLTTDNQCFIPWLLGSQSCEKIFRAARSMTPTFSTVLNFGMLSLLQRLHRIHIQYCLENDSETSEIIKYPRKEIHKDKDGHDRANLCDLSTISNSKIIETVNKAKEEAKRTIESLGMYDLLKKNNFEDPPIPYSEKNCSDDDNDDDDENIDDDENDETEQENELTNSESNNVWESSCYQDSNDITDDITKLNSIGIIEKDLCCHLSNLHKSQLKRISGLSLPMYDIKSSSSTKCTGKKSHSPYVEVYYGQRTVYINKTTVVWLLQEGERVSADRLFRVHNKQPFSSSSEKAVGSSSDVSDNGTNPVVSETLSVGDTCVFRISSTQWKVGRILSFSYFLEKIKTSQQYTKTIYNLAEKSKKPVGVLCSWYDPTEIPSRFVFTENCTSHRFISVELYICTLANGCFETLGNDKQFPSLVKAVKSLHVAMAKYLVLRSGTLTTIQNLLQTSATGSKDNPVHINDNGAITDYKTAVLDLWTRCGNINLSKKEKQDLLSGKELNDLHINAFQNLLKSQFTEIGGLNSTLLQSKTQFLKSELNSNKNILQIIHMPNHWAALQVFGSDICFYDSAYTTISDDTLDIIAQLMNTNAKSLTIKLMNVAKQIGVVNCGLHAIATVTCLALGNDPTTVVFNNDELRPHLLNIFETRKISAFPVKKRRKPQNSISKEIVCHIFCYCRLPEKGEMVCCEHCQEWFHITCIDLSIDSCMPDENDWFCSSCSDRLLA